MEIKKYKLTNGNTVKVFYDQEPSNPRKDFDNLGTMVCWHHKYRLGDEHLYERPENLRASLKELDAKIVLPLYLYDHSGQTISTKPFGCRWDSGQVGFIYVSRKKLLEEYGGKKVTKKMLEKAEKVILSEVELYDSYIRGDVYGFKEYDADGEEIDSYCGFYGDNDPNKNGIVDHFSAPIECEL